MINLNRTLWLMVAAFFITGSLAAQKPRPKPKPTPNPVIFAVLDGGKRVEPIAAVDKGKLSGLSLGDAAPGKAFAANYYKSKSVYPLIFGGAIDGSLTITKSNIGTECGGASADAIAKPAKAKLSALVMGLATNAKMNRDTPGFRRRPTTEERTAIEKLVSAEFVKQGAPATAVKSLRYHNLTALDVEDDDIAEFVGSYWIAPTTTERRLLFFIAEADENGKIEITSSEHSIVKPDDVMSGDVKDTDTGVGHELLLDVLDFNADGVREIFTIGQAFEGNNFYVYQRKDNKWTKIYETYNYRCAF